MTEKQYLKMADVFVDEVVSDSDCLMNKTLGEIADFSGYKKECRYTAHAINSHDELVEQLDKATRALESAGYTQLSPTNEWKPPIGPSASPLLQRIDWLVAENERLRELVRLARDCQSVQLSHLKSLLSSVSGDCYMGEEWEIEKIKSAIKYTIDHKW